MHCFYTVCSKSVVQMQIAQRILQTESSEHLSVHREYTAHSKSRHEAKEAHMCWLVEVMKTLKKRSNTLPKNHKEL